MPTSNIIERVDIYLLNDKVTTEVEEESDTIVSLQPGVDANSGEVAELRVEGECLKAWRNNDIVTHAREFGGIGVCRQAQTRLGCLGLAKYDSRTSRWNEVSELLSSAVAIEGDLYPLLRESERR
jgi:hypothetical protein